MKENSVHHHWRINYKEFAIECEHIVHFMLNAMDRQTQDPDQWLNNGMRDIYNKVIQDVNLNTKTGFTFSGLDTDYHVPFKRAYLIDFEYLWQECNVSEQQEMIISV